MYIFLTVPAIESIHYIENITGHSFCMRRILIDKYLRIPCPAHTIPLRTIGRNRQEIPSELVSFPPSWTALPTIKFLGSHITELDNRLTQGLIF